MQPPFDVYHDIQCVYSVSGSYGVAPRWSYYVLVLFVALWRKYKWLTAGAAAYCIGYGGTAAIHAIILAAIQASSTPCVPDGYVSAGRMESPWVAGRVLDQDVDASFAIVGSGFLTVLPIAVSTSAYRTTGAKVVVLFWACLMTIGMIACVVCLYSVDESSTGPFLQYRFCLPGQNDPLPISSHLPPSLAANWNDSVWDFLRNSNVTSYGTACFYPCLGSNQVIRDQTDILIMNLLELEDKISKNSAYYILALAVSAITPLTVVAGLALFLGQRSGYFPGPESPTFSGYASLLRNLRVINENWKKHFLIICLQLYALVIVPILLVLFIAFMEWTLVVDPLLGSIRHVGQWNPLVSIGFVIVVVVLRRLLN